MRSFISWEGKNDDAMPPKGVRDRIFEAHGRVCHVCKLPIVVPKMKWALDHMKAIQEGGENVEANLAPIHETPCHATKTAAENKRRDKAKRQRHAHHGIKSAGKSIQSRGFAEKPDFKPSKPERSDTVKGLPRLPPRSMFR